MKLDTYSWATVVLAVLFGALVVLPQIASRIDTDFGFQGIEVMSTDAEYHYAARAREAWDGHWLMGNTFYAQDKDQPYLQPPFPEASIALLSRLTGVNLATFFVFSKAFFAALLFVILTGFFVTVSGTHWPSLAAATGVLFASAAFSVPWEIADFLLGTKDAFDPLKFSRPINPLWTVPWFFLAYTFLALWLRSQKLWHMIASALCTVVLLYSYLYAWTFIGMTMAVIFAWFLVQRSWLRIRHLLIFAAIFFLCAIPYGMELWMAMHHEAYAATAERLGSVASHANAFGLWQVALLVLGMIAAYFWRKTGVLLIGAGIAAIVLMNQQILTGMFMVPHHYQWYFVQPIGSGLLIALSLYLFDRYVPLPSFIKTTGCTLIILGLVTFGVIHQSRAYASSKDDWVSAQMYAPIFAALNEDGEEEIVLAQDRFLLDLAAVYTSHNMYTSTNAYNYLTTEEKARDVYFFTLWLKGLTPEQAEARFYTDMRAEVSSGLYAIYYREFLGGYDAIPNNVIEQLINQYNAYYAQSDDEKICKYPFTVLVTTPDDAVSAPWRVLISQADQIHSFNQYTGIYTYPWNERCTDQSDL